jgi:hypothetical protein
MDAEIKKRPALGLESATQEPTKIGRERNDVVVWHNRASNDAFFTMELKTPETLLVNGDFIADACQKAQRWNAKYFALWNMQSAELYRTPEGNRLASQQDLIKQYPPNIAILRVDDWINLEIREQLKKQALILLDDAASEASRNGQEFPIDASVFVDRLTGRITELRFEIQPALIKKASQDRTLRTQLRQIAAAQGFLGFVDDIDAAIAGQFCYRVVGQILFYFALRRKQPSLPILNPDRTKPFLDAISPFWANVRPLDYDALFLIQDLDRLIPVTTHAEELIYDLIDGFNRYDWNSIKDDILGSIFEQWLCMI